MEDYTWILAMLEEVKDPEIPVISIVELGMVQGIDYEYTKVTVKITPTFLGCPALEIISQMIQEKLLIHPEINEVSVEFVHHPLWTSEQITSSGREKLRMFGIAPPMMESEANINCPYCGQGKSEIINLFGSAACRSVYYCKVCKEPFEAIKSV